MQLVTRFDRWVQEAYAVKPSSLGFYRIAFALVVLAMTLPEDLWISSFPDSFFDPPLGPTFFFFHGFPSAISLHVLNGIAIFAATCVLFGYRTRTMSVALGLTLIYLGAWEYSFGKINHAFMIMLIPLLFSWAGWGNAWSVDSAKRQAPASSVNPVPIALFAFILSVMMLLAAVPKITSGWLNPRTHAVLGHLLVSHFIVGRANWFSNAAFHIRSGWFWEPLDWFSCAVEAAFICVFFRRSLLLTVCAVATLFHFGIVLLMKIYSWGNVLAYAAIADWDEMVKFFPYSLIGKLAGFVETMSGTMVLVLSSVITAMYLTIGNPLARLIGKTAEDASFRIGLLIVMLGTATGSVFLIRLLWRLAARRIDRSRRAASLPPQGKPLPINRGREVENAD